MRGQAGKISEIYSPLLNFLRLGDKDEELEIELGDA